MGERPNGEGALLQRVSRGFESHLAHQRKTQMSNTTEHRWETKGRALQAFLAESWDIEGLAPPTPDIVEATERFLALECLTVKDVVELHFYYCGNQECLRDKLDGRLDVSIGRYTAPPSGPDIADLLAKLLKQTEAAQTYRDGRRIESSYTMYLKFEALHPFTDGNGRIGRAIWLWYLLTYEGSVWASCVRQGVTPFKTTFHYQACDHYSLGAENIYKQHGAKPRAW